MSTFEHNMDTLAKDLAAHTPDEQQHIMQGLVEGIAGTALKMTGNDALGNAVQDMAKIDFDKGNLSFGDYGDIFKTVHDLV